MDNTMMYAVPVSMTEIGLQIKAR